MNWLPNMHDVDWIKECGQMGLIILSGDKSIERVPEERQAVIDGKCKVFMFEDSDTTGTADWAASIVVAKQRIFDIATKASGPFFVTIKPCRVRGHISEPRFVAEAGGKWIPAGESQIVVPTPDEHKAQRPTRKQQGEFSFAEDVKV
jgi:hypothetical protein